MLAIMELDWCIVVVCIPCIVKLGESLESWLNRSCVLKF